MRYNLLQQINDYFLLTFIFGNAKLHFFAENVAGRAVEYNGISFLDLPRITCTRWETAESHDNRMIELPVMAELKLSA